MKSILNILIIEDILSDAGLIVRNIENAGYKVVYKCVDNAEALSTHLNSDSIWDIILSDFNMPVLDGFEALKILKETKKDIPFILVSGAIGEEIAFAAMKAGACDFIHKGNLLRLVSAIERGITESKTRIKAIQAETALQLIQDNLNKISKREALSRNIVEMIRITLDFEELRVKLVNTVGRAFNSDKCFFRDYDNKTKEFIHLIKFEYVTSPDLRKPYEYDTETNSSLIEKYRKQNYIYTEDFSKLVNESGPIGTIAKHQIDIHGVSTGYCFGLFDKEEFLGTFAVQYKEVTQLSDEDLELLKSIVSQISIAIKQARLYSKTKEQSEYLKKQTEREKTVRELSEIIRVGLDPSEIQKIFVMKIGKTFKADKCFIRTFDNDIFLPVQEYAEYFTSTVLKKEYFFSEEIEEFLKTEYKKGNNFIVPDLEEFINKPEPFHTIGKRHIEHYGIQSNYSFPIIVENKLIGAFLVQYKEKTYLDSENIELLNVIVNHAALTLIQSKLYLKEKESAKLKSEFIAIMSHELRTPLNIIMGYSKMLEGGMYGSLNEKQAKSINNIYKSGDHLLSLINDLLDISKIESGKMLISRESFELSGVLYQVITMMTELANNHKIGLSFDIQSDIGCLEADSMRFKQILINLISNSIKFNKNNGKVSVRLHKTVDNLWIQGEIEDTGIGIPKDQIPYLFDKFYQIDSSVSRKHEGTGLGLSIAHDLIISHGGDIEVKSEEGLGSTFIFRLPVSCQVMNLGERKLQNDN